MTMYRMKIIFPLLLIFVARSTLSINVVSSGLQRVRSGKVNIFNWTIDEPISNYTIFNQTTGSPTGLRENTFHYYDNTSGEITLTINDVQLWDAGNYSLQITQASTTTIDSTACLFVYGVLSGSLMLSSGRNPATEGDTLELTCNLTSTSLPAAYGPNIYYSWSILGYWSQETTFGGPMLDRDGKIIPGYIVINNGRTLAISSLQYFDFNSNQNFYCKGREDGGASDVTCSLSVEIRHKPYIMSSTPESKKFNDAYGKRVELGFFWISNPINLSGSWEFVNHNGVSQNLPPDSNFGSREIFDSGTCYTWLKFNFTSPEYYGNYSFNLTNAIGSTTVTFEVPPDDLKSKDHREDKNSLLIVVIALSILMGTVSLACLTAYLVRRFRTNRQLLPTTHYEGIIKHHANEESHRSPQDNVYEELEDDDHSYARIASTRNEMDGYETVF